MTPAAFWFMISGQYFPRTHNINIRSEPLPTI